MYRCLFPADHAPNPALAAWGVGVIVQRGAQCNGTVFAQHHPSVLPTVSIIEGGATVTGVGYSEHSPAVALALVGSARSARVVVKRGIRALTARSTGRAGTGFLLGGCRRGAPVSLSR